MNLLFSSLTSQLSFYPPIIPFLQIPLSFQFVPHTVHVLLSPFKGKWNWNVWDESSQHFPLPSFQCPIIIQLFSAPLRPLFCTIDWKLHVRIIGQDTTARQRKIKISTYGEPIVVVANLSVQKQPRNLYFSPALYKSFLSSVYVTSCPLYYESICVYVSCAYTHGVHVTHIFIMYPSL